MEQQATKKPKVIKEKVMEEVTETVAVDTAPKKTAKAVEVKPNIYQRLSAISIELSTVAKNLEVGVGKSKYKAVGEADVLRAVKPLEAKHGVYSYPYSRRILESGTIENESVDYTTKEKIVKKNLFERIETVYRFINVDSPSEYIDITTYGDGIDSQDKSVGKAMTYADKYALLKAYKIVTGEDPDQEPSGELKSVKYQAQRPTVAEDNETVSKRGHISQELISALESVNGSLEKAAVYYKKTVDELTEPEVRALINRVRERNNKQ